MFVRISFDRTRVVEVTDSTITFNIPFFSAFANLCTIFVATKANKLEDIEKEKGKKKSVYVGVNGGVSFD